MNYISYTQAAYEAIFQEFSDYYTAICDDFYLAKFNENMRYHQTPETAHYFYHPDHLGSASWITDSAGNDGSAYPGVPKLYNDKVSKDRGILIHIGNYPRNSSGCLLIGSSKSTDFVGNSGNTLKKLNSYIEDRGFSNMRLNIFNVISK
jgi:hypothetical protein